MQEHRDDRDQAGNQLMMEIFTRHMGDKPPPSRWWRGLGLVLLALGGSTGLLLATADRTPKMPDPGHILAPTLQGPASQLPMKEIQERANLPGPSGLSPEETLLPKTSAEASRPAVIPPSSGTQADRSPSSVSASPTTSRHPKALRARPRLMNLSKRGAACPQNDCRPRVARHQSSPRMQPSLLEEFDPNGVLVRSTP